MTTPTRTEMYEFYFSNPKEEAYIKEIKNVKVKYHYFAEPIKISTDENQVCNFCLLKGSSKLNRKQENFTLNQFDLVFLPPNEVITLNPLVSEFLTNKICIVKSPIQGEIGKEMGTTFEIQQFSFNKFVPRGELRDTQKMSTYREVWTAFKNGYFMSGFTNIPHVSLVQGVLTSVNLEKEDDSVKILSHVHPGYPEIYIFCIDDSAETVAVTQFLINKKGQSISRDLIDGEGIFFDGSLGHVNFTKPTFKKLKYCLYMWIIPTFGKSQDVIPTTLRT